MASIGSIFVDFVARTAGFQAGVKDAANSVQQSGQQMQQSNAQVGASSGAMATAVERGGLRVAAAFLGARTVGMAVAREFRDVYANIESLPGVSTETIESINRMKFALESTNGVLKQGIATLLGWFANFGEGIGYKLGAMVYGEEAAADAFDQMTAAANAFAAKKFTDDMAKLKDELSKVTMTAGMLGDTLTAEAAKLNAFANGNGGSQQDRWDAALKAIKDQIEARRVLNTLTKEGSSLNQQLVTLDAKVDNHGADPVVRLKDLLAQRAALIQQSLELRGTNVGGADDASSQQAMNNIAQARIKIDQQIISLQNKVKSAAEVMRDSFASAFEGAATAIADFVVDGKTSFSDFFKSLEKQLLETFLKLSLLNPILNSLFGKSTGWTTLPSFFGFAAGGRPPTNQPSIVGEMGPELFMPDTAGTIIPNSALAGMGGKGGGTNVFIDATGADQAAIARLTAALSATNASIERRAVGAIVAAMKQGGSTGRALVGA